MSEELSGTRHPMYGSGIGQDWRRCAEYHQWRDEVLDRADYECEVCGNEASHAHHMRPVSNGGEKYDADNGQALCKPCHGEAHGQPFTL